MTSDAFALYGTHEAEERPVTLTAGRLSADLANGNLRTVSYDGVEVLRAISYLVRDRDWGTYSPRIEDLTTEQNGESFSVGYTAHCDGPEGSRLAISVRIDASESRLTFAAEALTPTGFETNRCGFCILHPIVGIAGSPTTVEHVDGRIVETHFPDQIEPWQPFMDMRAISHAVTPGVSAKCLMEGDTFEMEDQRNWSDASYKTYVRPLALPWPYQITPNERQTQRIVLSIADGRPRVTSRTAEAKPVAITRGEKTGTMPPIGLIVTPEEAKATLAAAVRLAEIGPQELLFHYDPLAVHGAEAFTDFAALAKIHRGTTTLEIALPCKASPAEETAAIAAEMTAAGFSPDAVVVSPAVDRQSTPPGSKWPDCPPLDEVYAAALAAFPKARLGGGMLSYFTELNRKRVPAENLAFVTHCTNPIVHAADDLSVMQTLEALPFINHSVRAIYGDKPYRIGPSTIPMRQNPYGSRTMDNPGGKRIPMANTDPRHNGRFAEAFALAYASQVLDAGLECLTLSALTGSFGLIAGPGEPSPAGTTRPLFNAVKTLAGVAGRRWHECRSSAPSQVLGFIVETAVGNALCLVNITAGEQSVDISAVSAEGAPVVLSPYATTIMEFPAKG